MHRIVEQVVDLVGRQTPEPLHDGSRRGHAHADEHVALAVLARARLEEALQVHGVGRIGVLGERGAHIRASAMPEV